MAFFPSNDFRPESATNVSFLIESKIKAYIVITYCIKNESFYPAMEPRLLIMGPKALNRFIVFRKLSYLFILS